MDSGMESTQNLFVIALGEGVVKIVLSGMNTSVLYSVALSPRANYTD
jgi:hypothetical protein